MLQAVPVLAGRNPGGSLKQLGKIIGIWQPYHLSDLADGVVSRQKKLAGVFHTLAGNKLRKAEAELVLEQAA